MRVRMMTLSSVTKMLGIVFLVSAVTALYAQQMESSVKILLERLPLEKQQKLKNLSDELENYMQDHDWTGSGEDQFKTSISIFLQDISVNYEDRYSGTFVISNNDDVQFYDKYWVFPYQAGEPIYHDETIYNPFTGLIDFYTYLIIGSEYDKFGKFLGDPFFEKARNIANQAAFNVQFNKGWRERTELITYLMSDTNKPFREAKDAFFLGMSYAGEEDTTAQKYCRQALDLLEEALRVTELKDMIMHFIEAHHLELIDMFKGDAEALEQLIKIDPDRASQYEEYL